MTKEHVIGFIIFVLMIGILAGVYHFYFKEKKVQYQEDEAKMEECASRLKTLAKTFDNQKPDELVTLLQSRIQPWSDAVQKRLSFFSTGDLFKKETPPEGVILKFFYKEKSEAMFDDLNKAAYMRTPACAIPDDDFDTPTYDELRSKSVSEEDVVDWLKRIRFGCEATKLMIDANAARIDDMYIWPERTEYNNNLRMRTVGYSVRITLEDLVRFIEKLAEEDTYYTINGFFIRNTQLRYQYGPPYLQVDLIITRAFTSETLVKEEDEEGASLPAESAFTDDSSEADVLMEEIGN